MPCCAFAVFLIGQAMAFFAAFGESAAPPRVNPATEWRLGDPAPRAARAPRRFLRPIVVAACLEAVVLVAALGWTAGHLGASAEPSAVLAGPGDTAWCGRPLSDLLP